MLQHLMHMNNIEGIIRELESVDIAQLEIDVSHALRGGQVSSLIEQIGDIFDPYNMTLVCTTGEINTD
jgi:hypothetical protein